MEREEKEDKINKIKGFPLSKQVGFVLERENKFFLEGKKKILSCLEEKSDGFSLKEQYHLV